MAFSFIIFSCTKKSESAYQINPVTIGSQIWMDKNLDVTTYRNGDPIPQVQDSAAWSQLKTGAWCYYENRSSNGSVYGKLYNWYAVNDPRGLAPVGWHVPTQAEWMALSNYLGGNQVSGGKLKEAGLLHWKQPNTADNASLFAALPSGKRSMSGRFGGLGEEGAWWSSSAYDTLGAYAPFLDNSITNMSAVANEFFGYGLSVRCIRY